jgi:hypothetical protein
MIYVTFIQVDEVAVAIACREHLVNTYAYNFAIFLFCFLNCVFAVNVWSFFVWPHQCVLYRTPQSALPCGDFFTPLIGSTEEFCSPLGHACLSYV